MKLASFFLALMFCAHCFAEEPNKAILIEPEVVSKKENFTWNKWETQNFIILSIEKDHGLSLRKSIESIKHECADRWSLENADLKTKCKVICVRDAEMLKKFFGVDSPRAETRKDGSGKIATSAIWIDFDRIEELPSLVAFICVSEGSLGDNRLYVQRGISLLSLPSKRIKSELSQATSFDFSEISLCNAEKWFGLSNQERALFDKKSALVCLMLRKEFGEERFLKFLSGSQDQESIQKTYGFKDASEFNRTLDRYSENISKDIDKGIAPDFYFTIKRAKK